MVSACAARCVTARDWVPAGQVGVRRNVGGGTFVAGYRRALTEYDSLEAQGMVGASLWSCSVTVRAQTASLTTLCHDARQRSCVGDDLPCCQVSRSSVEPHPVRR